MLFINVVQGVGQVHRHKGIFLGQYGVGSVFIVRLKGWRGRNRGPDHGPSARAAAVVFPFSFQLLDRAGKLYTEFVADLVVHIGMEGGTVLMFDLSTPFL